MANLDNGTSCYIKGVATVETFFPVDRKGVALIVCDVCNYYDRKTRRCALTNEVIPWPDKYTGRACPMTLEENNDGEPWNL